MNHYLVLLFCSYPPEINFDGKIKQDNSSQRRLCSFSDIKLQEASTQSRESSLEHIYVIHSNYNLCVIFLIDHVFTRNCHWLLTYERPIGLNSVFNIWQLQSIFLYLCFHFTLWCVQSFV